MKSAGIVTINDNNNYGNRLQNYAVQEFLKKENIQPLTLKNIPIKNGKDKYILRVLKNYIKKILKKPSQIFEGRRKSFSEFNENIDFYEKEINAYSKISDQFDFFITGSDQVWNPNFGRLRDVDLLSFATPEQRISFSASFGISELPENSKKKAKKELEKFKAISVREDRGKEIVEELTGRKDVQVLVDSTMLLTSEEWDTVANKPGQFLNWVNLPELQLTRVDELYSLADKLKAQTGAKKLSVMGIGGSKHTVEHMLSINGLNICAEAVEFYSDVDSASLERFLYRLGNDVTSSNYMIASKSGSTFETKDGFLRVLNMLIDAYKTKGQSEDEAKKSAAKHFIAVTDKNAEKSELRRTSNENGWLGDLFIHDDVGGRFSAFDDHALFTLAYAGMKKEDMIKMLETAQKMSTLALTDDLDVNEALKEGIFWADAKLNGIEASVHQYMGSIFENKCKMNL